MLSAVTDNPQSNTESKVYDDDNTKSFIQPSTTQMHTHNKHPDRDHLHQNKCVLILFIYLFAAFQIDLFSLYLLLFLQFDSIRYDMTQF